MYLIVGRAAPMLDFWQPSLLTLAELITTATLAVFVIAYLIGATRDEILWACGSVLTVTLAGWLVMSGTLGVILAGVGVVCGG